MNTWKQLIKEWNNQDFDNIIFKKTINGIVNDPEKDIKSNWENYLNWIKTEFASSDITQQIDLLWTNNAENRDKFDNLVVDGNLDNIKGELIYSYATNDELLNVIRTSVLQKLDNEWNTSKNNILVQTFSTASQSSYNGFKQDIKKTERIDEITFLFQVFKRLYLTNFPQSLAQVINEEPPIDLNDLSSEKKQVIENLLIEFSKTEEVGVENDVEINATRSRLNNISLELVDAIQELKTKKLLTKQPPKYDDEKVEKLKEIVRWQTSQIKELIKIVYAYQQTQSNSPSNPPTPNSSQPTSDTNTSDNSRPPSPTHDTNKPEPIQPTPKPTPDQNTKPIEPTPPSKTPEQIQAEKDAQELKTLKDDIAKLPLNTTEQTVLTNAKNKTEAEAVRTQYNQRIKTEQEQKEEIVKYDNLLNIIKSEIDLTKLGDGGEFDSNINKLKPELLPTNKQPSHLQDERKLKLKQLQNIQKTKEQTAKAQQVLKSINEETNLANLPDDNTIKSSYEDDLLDDELKYTELIKARDNKRNELLTAQALANFNTLLNEISAITDISKLPTDQQIKDKYNDALLADNQKYANVIVSRNNKLKQLQTEQFKKDFEGTNPTNANIEPWLNIDNTNPTGLNATQARTAYDNGWQDPHLIIAGKQTYQGDEVEVLKHNKTVLDQANTLIQEAKTKTTFKSLDDWKATKLAEINALDNSKLPDNKSKEQLLSTIQAHRDTFIYKIDEPNNEVDGDGLNPTDYQDAVAKEADKWTAKTNTPLTAAILNELLKDYRDPTVVKEELQPWLKTMKGYTLDTEPPLPITVAEVKVIDGKEQFTGQRVEMTISGAKVEEIEERWSKEERLDLQGAYKLAYVHKMIDFNLDDYRPQADGTYNKEVFAKLKENGLVDLDGKGVAPILTGGGKTTKDVACLVEGGKSNIILVCPNEALAGDAEFHHKNWLQKTDGVPYKCVLHGVHHGFYDTVRNDLIYYDDRSNATFNKDNKQWEGVVKKGKKGLSILQAEKLLGFIACSTVNPAELSLPSAKALADLQKQGLDNKDWEANVAKIKTKLISKDETIIAFDEAHFAKDAKYQDLYKQLIKSGYQVIIMSATFPRKKFSVSASHPRKIWLVPEFEPEYLTNEDGSFQLDDKGNKIEKWSVQKTQIFLPSTEDEWELSTTGKKVKQIKWSGLTKEQKELLDTNNIAYVAFDRTNQTAVSGITDGYAGGSLFLANSDHEMGFSPFIHNVILTGKDQSISLGKGNATPWLYDSPQINDLALASMVQQIGRVARLFPGDAYLLTKTLQDVDADGNIKLVPPAKDLSYRFVSAIVSGDLKLLYDYGIGNMGKYDPVKKKSEPNFLRAAVALPYKFGQAPEEIIVGLKGLVPNYPVYGNKPTTVDEELWIRHTTGQPTPPVLDIDKAKQIIFLIFQTKIKTKLNAGIDKGLSVSVENPLLQSIWNLPTDKKKAPTDEDQTKVATELRKVLNKLISEQIDVNKKEYLATEKAEFERAVSYHRLASKAQFSVVREYKKELPDGKPDVNSGLKNDYTIKIDYNPLAKRVLKSKIPTLKNK